LVSTDIADSIIDGLLEEAHRQVQDALRLTFTTSAKNFKSANTDQSAEKRFEVDTTGIIFNGRDLYKGNGKTVIFLKQLGRFGDLQTLTAVDYRTNDADSWEEQVVGNDQDYDADYKNNAVIVNFTASMNSAFRLTGTYGVVSDPMTDLPFKYKQLIALIAARNGVVYASGGSWDDVKSFSIFEVSTSLGEFAPNWRGQVEQLDKRIVSHLNAYGFALSKESVNVV